MRSLYNPFSPLRYMNLWEVDAFGDDDSGSSGSSDDNQQAATTTAAPVYDNYYDAIDAEGVGATVNIGGQNVIAATADGYTGSSSSDDTSNPNAGMSMADQYASYGQGNQGTTTTTDTDTGSSGLSDYEQAAFGTTQEDFYNNQGNTNTGSDDANNLDIMTTADTGSYDEIPTAAQINASIGFPEDEDYTPTSAELNAAIAAAGGVNLTDPEYAEPVDFTTTASGDDYNTVAEADTDESGFQYVADIDPVTGENTTGSTLASDDVVVAPVDDTPAPVYTDSAGVPHSTQAAADAADAQYAEAARLENERIEAEKEAERIQALINQVVAQDSAQNITAAPVAEDADLGAAIAAAEAFDLDNNIITEGIIPDDATITYDGNQGLGASGKLDDSRFDFVDDLPDDRFDFVDETEALLAELGVDVDLLGDNTTTDAGINLESYDDANDFVETPVTNLDKVQDLVDSGVDRSLAQALVESGGTPGEPAGIDKYDFGNVTELEAADIKGKKTAPSVITELALGGGDPEANTFVSDDVGELPSGYVAELGGGDPLDAFGGAGADITSDVSTGTSIPTEAEINAFRDQEAGMAGVSGTNSVISDTIKELEGFADGSYFDVTAEGGGFGSDTKTDPITGEVTTITEGMTVTKEEAEADLNRRLTTEFVPSVVDAVGADMFYSMPSTTQAALTSIAYNYGAGWADKLPTLAAAAKTGDKNAIADAIADRAVDNDGINAGRRTREADMVRTGVPLGGDSDAYVGMAKSASVTGAPTSNIGIPTAEEISGGSGATGTDLYLSAVNKISTEGYDPEESNLTEPEQRALYGARGQTPNAAESTYLNDLLSDATHKEDSTEKDVNGNPIYKAGDKVTVQSFGEKLEDGIVGFIDTFLNPLSIFGDKFTIGGANAAKVEAQLEAYKNGGTFIYNDDGAVTGVASPNFDASGDGNNDTVVLFDESGKKTVTGDGIAVTDVVTSNKFSDGEEFDIDIVSSVNTYKNPEDEDGEVVVESSVVVEDETGDDDDFIICEEGFEFDPVEGICMPIAGVGDGSGTGGGTGGSNLGVRDIRESTPVTGRPVQPTAGALKIRKPAQFAQGGMVTSNIDNFLGTLRGQDERP